MLTLSSMLCLCVCVLVPLLPTGTMAATSKKTTTKKRTKVRRTSYKYSTFTVRYCRCFQKPAGRQQPEEYLVQQQAVQWDTGYPPARVDSKELEPENVTPLP